MEDLMLVGVIDTAILVGVLASLVVFVVVGGAMWLMLRSRKNIFLGIIGAIVIMAIHGMLATSFAVNAARGTDYLGAYIAWQILVIVLWSLVFVVCRAKNRYAPTWLIATFFFGPIPLVILAFMPRLEYRDDELHKCLYCLSSIPLRASVCRFCQREIPSAATTPAPSAIRVEDQSAPEAQGRAACKYCGGADAEVRGLYGNSYHRACHVQALAS
jgi:hypothetical protein